MSAASHMYLGLAAAYVRGSLPDARGLGDEEAVAHAKAQGLRIHRFKRNAELPRVRAAVGVIRSFCPGNLLDVGSGRGAFLWPLMDAFPWMPVTSLEADPERHRQLACVSAGGADMLTALNGDVRRAPFDDGSFDAVTVLEVLEHLPDPEKAVAECVRVAGRVVVASVPSKPDDNPGHIQLFTPDRLERMFLDCGALTAKIDHVPGHMICIASV